MVHPGKSKPNLDARAKVGKAARIALPIVLASSMITPLSGWAFAEEAETTAAEEAADQTEAATPDFRGYATVQKVLNGGYAGIPPLEDLAGIDYEALRAWNPQAFNKISALYAEAKKAAEAEKTAAPDEAGEPEPSAPEEGTDPNAPSQPEADGSQTEADAEEPEATEAPEEEEPDAALPAPDETAAEDVAPDDLPQSQDPYDETISYPKWSYHGNTSFVMRHYTDDMDAQKLIAVIGEEAREVARAHGVKASQLIAQAILCSDSGRSASAQAPKRNLFNAVDYRQFEVPVRDLLESFAFGEPKIKMETRYSFGDQPREYATYKECLDDYADRMAKGIGAASAENTLLKEGSETWEKVQELIEAYELERYDNRLEYETETPLIVSEWDEAAGETVEREVSLTDLVADVTSHLGVPYVWGGTTTAGFDCSGLVQYAYREALQMPIARTSYYQCTQGEDVDFADLHMGDLVFFTKKGVVGHVGMYLAEGCFIEAPQTGMNVKITAMDEKMPTFAKRLVPTVEASEQAAGEPTDARETESQDSPDKKAIMLFGAARLAR